MAMLPTGLAMGVEAGPYKRPASPGELSMPPAKISKTGANQLQINYLKREKKETIPLATPEEPLPRLLRLIGEYDGVLQRHESLAGNLGACPVGPILLKRFERLFEGPPRILKTNSRDPNITWLDVVEFAQNKPEQFDLEKTRNGIRVCQFYLKQCRVEISEEDYVLIRSGMPQKLIPPQPILEDEEKELGVIDVLDRNLGKIIHSADQVSARARQLSHRLKGRRAAILARRESDTDVTRSVLRSNDHPSSPALDQNGMFASRERPFQSMSAPSGPPPPPAAAPQHRSPATPYSGFTAVNPRHSISSEAPSLPSPRDVPHLPHHHHHHQEHLVRETGPDGTPSAPPAQPVTRPPEPKDPVTRTDDWMSKFLKPSERAAGLTADQIRREQNVNTLQRSTSRDNLTLQQEIDRAKLAADVRRQELRDPVRPDRDLGRRQSEVSLPEKTLPPTVADAQGSVAIPNTPASLMPQQKPQSWNRDDGGPYKAEMISRMETMKRGERVIPPCDRCRRLHMDCIKNLTACLGCTKKHAKCSWKEVSLDELETTAPAAREREQNQSEGAAPSTTEWDNLLNRTVSKDTQPEQSHESPASASAAEPDTEASSNKATTPRIPSPPQNGTIRSPSHVHESPRLNVKPPPLDQQLRDAADDRRHLPEPTSRFSPFQRPPSQQHAPAPLNKDDSADQGDRLAAIASQVYRSASQNANRLPEPMM